MDIDDIGVDTFLCICCTVFWHEARGKVVEPVFGPLESFWIQIPYWEESGIKVFFFFLYRPYSLKPYSFSCRRKRTAPEVAFLSEQRKHQYELLTVTALGSNFRTKLHDLIISVRISIQKWDVQLLHITLLLTGNNRNGKVSGSE